MVKKKRGKCAKNNLVTQVDEEPTNLKNAPHSFVIQRGFPCPKLHDLTMDFRKVMEPFTATHLKERKKNKIKDFVSVSGTFHVANMCVFNRSAEQVMMKIGRLPRGPTMVFKIHQFTLARDVISKQKRSFVEDKAFDNAPLAILNNFSGDGKHMKLLANTLQNMFPNINVGTVKLSTIRRCVLFSYNPTTELIDFRHFAIRVQPVGVSKGVKKIMSGKIPNLGKCEDIADFIEKANGLSDSEFDDDDGNQVTVSQPMKLRGTVEDGKSAIKLHELGPRMTLQLLKVEDGLFNGEILYHNSIVKSEEEKEVIRKKIQQRKKLKEERSKEQEENKKRKEDKKVEHKNKSLAGMKRSKPDDDDDADGEEEQEEDGIVQDDDADYYREEVGEAPDEQLFTKGSTKKRPYTPKYGKAKKARADENNGNDNKFKGSQGKGKGKSKVSGTFRKGPNNSKGFSKGKAGREGGGGGGGKKGLKKVPGKRKPRK